MPPAPKDKCCRTTPRCRRCPVLLAAERRSTIQLVASLQGGGDLPPHLEGLPQCLHKYEPVLRPRATEPTMRPRAVEPLAA